MNHILTIWEATFYTELPCDGDIMTRDALDELYAIRTDHLGEEEIEELVLADQEATKEAELDYSVSVKSIVDRYKSLISDWFSANPY